VGHSKTRLAALLPVALAAVAAGCDDDDCVSDDARGNTVVSCSVTWGEQAVRLTGALTVESGADLALSGATLTLVPPVDAGGSPGAAPGSAPKPPVDVGGSPGAGPGSALKPPAGAASTGLELDDGASLGASGSTLEAGPGAGWTIEAAGGATASFEGTRVSGPVLVRMLDQTQLTVTGGQLGEIDARDDAAIMVTGGTWASVVATSDRARATFDGVTLLEGAAAPSFTAGDASVMVLRGMRATERTRVYTIGGGRVIIEGGSGWTSETLRPGPGGTGGITVLP
jgi:hypothetical protein